MPDGTKASTRLACELSPDENILLNSHAVDLAIFMPRHGTSARMNKKFDKSLICRKMESPLMRVAVDHPDNHRNNENNGL
jgi:hypothetical protein